MHGYETTYMGTKWLWVQNNHGYEMTVVMKQPWVQNDHGYEMTIGTNYWYTSSKKKYVFQTAPYTFPIVLTREVCL